MNIVKGGIVQAVIVIPKEATKREIFAASELQKYLAKISGEELSIVTDENVTDKEEFHLILIGGPERNLKTASYVSEEEFDTLVPGPDGMMIKTVAENVLVLAGSSKNPNERERGTVYAVYEFLERYLKCSFVAYGKPGSELGEYVPRTSEIALSEIEYVKAKGDLTYRTAIVQFDGKGHKIPNADANHGLTASLIDWMAKNRLNRILLMMNSYEMMKKNGVLEEIEKRGISITAGHHDSSMLFLPPAGNEIFPEHYYETHPEYYRLQEDGTRYFAESKWAGQLIFDMRSIGCIEQIAVNIVKWLKDNPAVDIVNLWPNDAWAPNCCCEECAKHKKTSNYAWFANEVAKRVGKECPNVKIDMLVYLDLWRPAVGVEFVPNLLVEVATWGKTFIMRRYGLKDGSGLIGSYVEENAMIWGNMAGKMAYYDYYMTTFDNEQIGCPMADEIISIYRHFTETDYCTGSGTQMEAFNLWNYLFNFYTHGRSSYDVSLTLEDLLERFIRIFGAGAPYIKEYMQYAEDFNEGQCDDGKAQAPWFNQNVDHKMVYDLFEKAFRHSRKEDCGIIFVCCVWLSGILICM